MLLDVSLPAKKQRGGSEEVVKECPDPPNGYEVKQSLQRPACFIEIDGACDVPRHVKQTAKVPVQYVRIEIRGVQQREHTLRASVPRFNQVSRNLHKAARENDA